ncbi:photosystem II assembly protein Psb34 [Spirulina subsalsa]|uniref:photosystem II assembly protein Psb34 n=1 Tax=Spirulina subsalsa TaxID=54311 RepID=UPI00030669E6|nr:ssl1498 family light-harvesting-like protein [Spirulina subsalsa]
MYTTISPEGQLNNYASEPKMYYAQYPNQAQQKRYVRQGALALLLVTSLILMAFAVS